MMRGMAIDVRRGLAISGTLWMLLFACNDHSEPVSDSDADGGASSAASRHPAMDAAVRPGMDAAVRMDGRSDAGARDSGVRRDAGADSGSKCEPARCPRSDVILNDGNWLLEQKPCCVQYNSSDLSSRQDYVGTCGVLIPQHASDDLCEPLLDGVQDESCFDTVINGLVIEGCRRPDRECGHFTAGWGCHRQFRRYWDSYIRDEVSTLPNPFNCTSEEEPCTRTNECCFHPSYEGLCWLPNNFEQAADAEVPVGICTNGFVYVDFGPGHELPRY
jgi:hypothetical protein